MNRKFYFLKSKRFSTTIRSVPWFFEKKRSKVLCLVSFYDVLAEKGKQSGCATKINLHKFNIREEIQTKMIGCSWSTVPKVIDFPRCNMNRSGENEILR